MDTLSPLGQLIEERRRALGLSKQGLASRGEISRQHLWRIMTGRTVAAPDELRRLSRVLEVELGEQDVEEQSGQWEPEPEQPKEASAADVELEEYVSNMDRLVRTLRTTPGGPLGIPLRLAILDAARTAAEQVGATLPREYYDIRRRVLTGEL